MDRKKVGRVGKMYDAGKLAVESLASELTKNPEELKPDQLEKAKGLANVFTEVRKALYLFFYIAAVGTILSVLSSNMAPDIIKLIVTILLVIFLLFKIRDLIRGKI